MVTSALPCITSEGITQGGGVERNAEGYPSLGWGKLPQTSFASAGVCACACAGDFRLCAAMISVEMTVLLFFIFLFSSCPFLCLPLCLKTFFALRFITSEQGDGSHIEVITTCFFSIRKNSLTVYFRLAFFKLYHTEWMSIRFSRCPPGGRIHSEFEDFWRLFLWQVCPGLSIQYRAKNVCTPEYYDS